MYVVQGRLTPEVAAVLMRAVEAASDALFQEARRGEGEAPEPAQLRADAVGLVAQRALAAGFQGADAPVSGSRAERYQVSSGAPTAHPRSLRQTAPSKIGGLTDSPFEGPTGRGPQVMLHVDESTLKQGTERGTPRGAVPGAVPDTGASRKAWSGLSELEDGTRVTAVRSDQALPVGEEVRM